MKQKLMNAAKALSKQMRVSQADFDNSGEKLDEGFSLIRAPKAVHDSICEAQGLNPGAVELVFMCLKPAFANGRTYSLPHKHYKKSLTAVVPMSTGGTFLSSEIDGLLLLNQGACFIEGDKAHAFGMNGNEAFVAALAVANMESDTAPIRRKDGTYRTTMLPVKKYTGDSLHVLNREA